MAMVPALVWALKLDVLEAVRGVIRLDPTPPGHRDAQQRMDFVLELQPVGHLGLGEARLEAHGAGGYAAQVLWSRKEGEDRVDRERNDLSGFEAVRSHVSS